MYPLETDLGWWPKTPLDLISSKEVPVESVNDFQAKLKSSLEDAQLSYKITNARHAA